MSKRKIGALAVGELFALSAIGNAISPPDSKTTPFGQW